MVVGGCGGGFLLWGAGENGVRCVCRLATNNTTKQHTAKQHQRKLGFRVDLPVRNVPASSGSSTG